MKKKVCTKCGKNKLFSEFHKNKSTKDGLNQWCKKCLDICRKKWYKKNKKVILKKAKENYKPDKEKTRAYLLKSRHNLTVEQYNKILKNQKYKCGICGKPQKNEKRHLAVDHNHKTKRIRGLLCYFCNSQLLKYFRDNRKIIEGFIVYFNKELKDDKNWEV